MLFIALMALSSTAVASIAAFFSVYGLAHTFTGAFWSVVAMGSSLEAGKLMLASFVYRFRDVVGWRIKMPAYAFIMVLMMITSTGIYGYLSAAYQAESAGGQQVTASLELKKQEQTTLQQRKVQIDQQIAQLPTNNVRGRQQLMRQFAPEEKQLDEKLAKVSQDIQDLSQQQITSNAHIGPIVYIAKVFGLQPDSAIALLMGLIIFVFDPLAMLLTIATNIAVEKHQKDKVAKKQAEDDELVFRGKGWEPKKTAPEYVQKIVEDMKSLPEKEPDPDALVMKDDYTFGPYPADASEHHFPSEPEKTGIDAIDRYNEDYWDPNEVPAEHLSQEEIKSLYETFDFEPPEFIVEEHGSEETLPVMVEEKPEPQPILPDWVEADPLQEPVVLEQEEVKPLNEEPVYEMGEATPLNEDPVYEMQKLEDVSPILGIKQIEQEIDEKPELSQEEQEMRDMIKRFFNRQDLIRSTRRD